MLAGSIQLGASVLAADFLRLGDEVREAEADGVDFIHFDVMDGRFVPNISMGLPVLEALRAATKLPIDVHLMIVEPERWIGPFAEAGADRITVHAEACAHLHGALRSISEAGAVAGVATNPGTPLSAVEEVLPVCGQLLVMSVNPGFGGQSFIPTALDKLERARAMIEAKNPACLLEVDGGVKASNVKEIVASGADTLVAGSSIFGHKLGIKAAVDELRAKIAEVTG